MPFSWKEIRRVSLINDLEQKEPQSHSLCQLWSICPPSNESPSSVDPTFCRPLLPHCSALGRLAAEVPSQDMSQVLLPHSRVFPHSLPPLMARLFFQSPHLHFPSMNPTSATRLSVALLPSLCWDCFCNLEGCLSPSHQPLKPHHPSKLSSDASLLCALPLPTAPGSL